MALVKIKLNTWNRCGNRETKFKRTKAPREGFIEINPQTKQLSLKPGSTKWKPWDTTISRHEDKTYIIDKKQQYSGLCFENKQQAKNFMEKHQKELDKIAAENPIFDHWSVVNIINRFKPEHVIIYGKDLIE